MLANDETTPPTLIEHILPLEHNKSTEHPLSKCRASSCRFPFLQPKTGSISNSGREREIHEKDCLGRRLLAGPTLQPGGSSFTHTTRWPGGCAVQLVCCECIRFTNILAMYRYTDSRYICTDWLRPYPLTVQTTWIQDILASWGEYTVWGDLCHFPELSSR